MTAKCAEVAARRNYRIAQTANSLISFLQARLNELLNATLNAAETAYVWTPACTIPQTYAPVAHGEASEL
jgi:hypothetical protein